ncbi:G-protein coupled bile acid receptor 1 [Microcaecilia unicolor]|uniref:G-protein coupled bile acid receptor 1 n=1 Tax=Microcaecilia unicolor TaxID=1415580 RepID=A0A6P7YD85_9AMPH|nr:G-protein coupled bile acid receptor 1 [Microcaecilia unicolor]
MENCSDQDGERFQRNLIFYLSTPLSAFIILANLFIIVGIIFNRKLHDTANYFFLSLLFADFLTGVALPFIPRMKFCKDLDYHSCLFVYISPNFFFLSFLSNLLMVHYEKYLCIIYPLRYRSFWVHRFVPLPLLLVWTVPLVFSCLPVFGWNQWGENSTCSYAHVFPNAFLYLEIYGFLIPSILAITFLTIKVLSVARRQLQDIKKLHRSVQREGALTLEKQMDLRYAKCIASVSLIFLVCWVPYIACLHVSVLAMEQYEISRLTFIILTCVGSGSAAVIPVILGLSNKQYTALWQAVFKKHCVSRGKSQEKGATRPQDKPSQADTLDSG